MTYKRINLNQLSKTINVTYSHSNHLMNQYIEGGYISRIKIGRNLQIELTEKGKILMPKIIECLKGLEIKFIEDKYLNDWKEEHSYLTIVYDPEDKYDWFTLIDEHQVKDVKTEELKNG